MIPDDYVKLSEAAKAKGVSRQAAHVWANRRANAAHVLDVNGRRYVHLPTYLAVKVGPKKRSFARQGLR